MLTYGVSDTLGYCSNQIFFKIKLNQLLKKFKGSYGFGYLIKYVGRIPIFILASLINSTCIGIMIFWQPTDNSFILYIVAILWGLGDRFIKLYIL